MSILAAMTVIVVSFVLFISFSPIFRFLNVSFLLIVILLGIMSTG